MYSFTVLQFYSFTVKAIIENVVFCEAVFCSNVLDITEKTLIENRVRATLATVVSYIVLFLFPLRVYAPIGLFI